MRSLFGDVPWGNLWRWVVSSLFFFLVLGMPIAMLTTLDEGATAGPFQAAVVVLGSVLAAIAVWSDEVPWPGDPGREHGAPTDGERPR